MQSRLLNIGSASRLGPHRSFQRRDEVTRRQRNVVWAVQKSVKPPSMQPSATELESLERLSTVVPDTLLMREITSLGKPKAASVTPRILSSILSNPSSFPVYKNAIEKGMAFSKDPQVQLNKAFANVGALFAKEVEGRVSTFLDPRSANDTEAMIRQAKDLVRMYTDIGVSNDRLLIQLPATWEGIQAVDPLESQGICTIVNLVYSFCQAVAAAQMGTSVVLINMGRIDDWYQSHPGVIRDPTGPRQDAGGASGVSPAQELVKKVFVYCKRYHPKTKIMVSGARTRDDALSIAGVDFIVLNPKVMQLLNETPTAEGYNDDLSGISEGSLLLGVENQMPLAEESEPLIEKLTQNEFNEALGYAGKDLLAQNLQRLKENMDDLVPILSTMALGTE